MQFRATQKPNSCNKHTDKLLNTIIIICRNISSGHYPRPLLTHLKTHSGEKSNRWRQCIPNPHPCWHIICLPLYTVLSRPFSIPCVILILNSIIGGCCCFMLISNRNSLVMIMLWRSWWWCYQNLNMESIVSVFSCPIYLLWGNICTYSETHIAVWVCNCRRHRSW